MLARARTYTHKDKQSENKSADLLTKDSEPYYNCIQCQDHSSTEHSLMEIISHHLTAVQSPDLL